MDLVHPNMHSFQNTALDQKKASRSPTFLSVSLLLETRVFFLLLLAPGEKLACECGSKEVAQGLLLCHC